MLYIFSGLPCAGKTTLARHLARHVDAAYLRIDSIEEALRQEAGIGDGPEGYAVAYRIAGDNLRLGAAVVADSVNPLQITREAWRDVAARSGAMSVDIEVVCSDVAEHRARVEERAATTAGPSPLTWEDVRGGTYERWEIAPLVIDTAGRTESESFAELQRALVAFRQ